MLLLAPFYIGGVFLFSYGYELYNLPRALRDTAIIVFITVASVVIIAVLFVALGAMSGGSSSRSSSKSESSSSGSRASSGGSGGGFSSGGSFSNIGPIFLGGTGSTHTVTREVVREVPVAPPKPQPITCPYCGRAYVPAENKYACPNCGGATPEDLRAQSETSESNPAAGN